MSILFQPLDIKGMRLKNRLVRSATHDGCSSEQGEITDKSVDIYSGLAQGGAGLIITGYACVHPTGQSFLHQTTIYSDDRIPGLKRLADEAHRYGANIALQLAHCGRNSYAVRARGGIPPAPSLVENDPLIREAHREMTVTEIDELIAAFGQAARRAREAGFDAVQLHGAHSYLLSQFLSPLSNRRTDRWGGSPDNRMRFHIEVIKAIRQTVGQDYPLLIKLGIRDTAEGGLTLEEGCRVAEKLANCGIDAIEVSEGLELARANHIRKGIKAGGEEAYYAEWAKEVRKSVNVPVMLVGGIRSFHLAESLVENKYADAISMCRPYIREPDIVHRWQGEDRSPVKCISCNLCLENTRREQPVVCVQESRKHNKIDRVT